MSPTLSPRLLRRRRDLHRLRREARGLADSLRLPAGCGLDALCHRVSAHRGRPLQIIPMDMEGWGISGGWIDTVEADLVIHESSTSVSHQQHIVAHELAHMLCGHGGSAWSSDDVSRKLFPDLDPALVRQMLSRDGYEQQCERVAEVVATVLLERFISVAPQSVSRGEPVAVITRIDGSLGGWGSAVAGDGHGDGRGQERHLPGQRGNLSAGDALQGTSLDRPAR